MNEIKENPIPRSLKNKLCIDEYSKRKPDRRPSITRITLLTQIKLPSHHA